MNDLGFLIRQSPGGSWKGRMSYGGVGGENSFEAEEAHMDASGTTLQQ